MFKRSRGYKVILRKPCFIKPSNHCLVYRHFLHYDISVETEVVFRASVFSVEKIVTMYNIELDCISIQQLRLLTLPFYMKCKVLNLYNITKINISFFNKHTAVLLYFIFD
jgi:hypothetical protein